MSTPNKSDIDPQRLGVVLIVAFILFLVVGALPEMLYSREPGGGIGGLISLGVMGLIMFAPGWFTFRARRNGWSGWAAFLLPVAAVLALFVFFFALETSHVINIGGMFPASLLLGITCMPVVMIVCGVTAAVTDPAGKREAEAQPKEDDTGKQTK